VYLEKVHHSNSKQGKLTFIDDPPQITEPTNTKKKSIKGKKLVN